MVGEALKMPSAKYGETSAVKHSPRQNSPEKSHHSYTPKLPYRVFNTWMGDPGKLILLEKVINVINKDNLLVQVQKTGEKLKCGLFELQKEYYCLINSIRGRGTFLAGNAETPELRDDLLKRLKQKGVQVGACGSNSFRLRPALIFQEHHADIFLDKFRQVLQETK